MRWIYVAGASAEVDRIRPIMENVRRLGACIVHDWTADMDEWATYNARRHREHAAIDLMAVTRSDGLLAVPTVSGKLSQGAAIEVGAALVSRVPVVIFAADGPGAFSPWAQMPGVWVEGSLGVALRRLGHTPSAD